MKRCIALLLLALGFVTVVLTAPLSALPPGPGGQQDGCIDACEPMAYQRYATDYYYCREVMGGTYEQCDAYAESTAYNVGANCYDSCMGGGYCTAGNPWC